MTPPLAALTEVELERLVRVAERLLAGRTRLLPGPHAVRRRAGSGGEFRDHRPYLPGDELRTVDWRTSLRSRELQVRRYQDEAAGDWFICLDRSASMGLFDKWSLAVQLAAAWAYLLLHLDHRVGLVSFSSRVDGLCPLGRGHDHYGQILRFLRATSPRPEGGGSVLGGCADAIGRRVAIMVISDFLAEDGMQAGLAKLPGTEIHALQVLAEAELQLPATAQVTLQDVETRRRLLLYLSPPEQALARTALTRLQEHLAGYCRKRSIVFTSGRTGQFWREVLLDHTSTNCKQPMLSLATPLWLIGLAAVPLLWWLHRLRDTGQLIAVSALFLWRPAAQASAAGQQLARPDPQWRLRAGIVVCLLLALANPRWQVQQPAIEVWLDDSLSMYTLEDGVSRLAAGIDKLLQALQQAAYPKVTVHSLANPAKTLALDAAHSERWRSHLLAGFHSPAGNEPLPPPVVQMDSHAEHWLVSDGVHPALQDWLQTAPVTQVIQVGKVRENVALTTLAARFPLTESGTLQVLVTVANPGEQPAARELELVLDDRSVYRQKLELTPGAMVRRNLRLPSGSTLRARLSPVDALPLDDELLLTIPASVKLRIVGNCGLPLRNALAAHPRLQQVETSSAALTVACLDRPPMVNGPLLLLHSAQNGRPVRDTPRWQPAAGALQQLVLESGWLASMSVQPHPAASEPLLTAGDNPLILSSAGPARVIDVWLDMEAPEWVRRPEYPVLVQGLIDLALGRALLGEFISIQRDPKASQIAPRPLQLMEKALAIRPAADSKDLSPGLLGVCGLLLLLDMWRQYRLVVNPC